jgi:hypothetical protein
MIAAKRFVFLHLHKSGGTFVNDWLLRFFPDAQQIGYHLPRRLIPPQFASLPVIGLVRNPWSYYVSWYAFQSTLPRPNALFRILSEQRTLGFEGTIRNMLNLGTGGVHLDAVLGVLPVSYGDRGLNLPGPELAAIRGTALGFYSFLYRYMYAGEGPLHVVRMEEMCEELPRIIAAVGERISEAGVSYLADAPALNRSAHRPYAAYYDNALQRLIAERDADVIEEHAYCFGQ